MSPHEFYALNPTEFEQRVGEILGRNGYRAMRHAGRSGDHGIDLRCQDKRSRHVVVQCKLYVRGHNVGEDAIRNLLGSMQVDGAEKAIFVTSSTFTSQAREVATRAGMALTDGDELAAMGTSRAALSLRFWSGPLFRALGKAVRARPRIGIAIGLFLVALVAMRDPLPASTIPPMAQRGLPIAPNAQATYAASHRAAMTIQ